MNRLVLSELSWPEFDKYKDDIEVAIIPAGSHEQHGPNLTFATDTDRAYEMGKLLAEELYPRVMVCPPLNYGISYHHMKFPGTMTLNPDTFVSMIMDIGWSLKEHGINKILLLNAHGGNRPALGVATVKLKKELDIDAAWIGSGTDIAKDLLETKGLSKIRGHACEGEVSQSMYIAPWLVKETSLEKSKLKDTLYGKRKFFRGVRWDFYEVTENGALGDATLASYELGKEMTELILKRLKAFVCEYFFNEEISIIDEGYYTKP